MMMSRQLVLASTSLYRRELLRRLGLPFETADPLVDETPLGAETPSALAERLALAKAAAVAPAFPGALIIGSDQVAHRDGQIFDKPLVHERAAAQLRAMRGHAVVFHTAVCLFDNATGSHALRAEATEVRFRALTDTEIERYLEREQPYHCAGSAKAEGLGISLLEYIRGNDPNALIGLPLIALCELLRRAGVAVP